MIKYLDIYYIYLSIFWYELITLPILVYNIIIILIYSLFIANYRYKNIKIIIYKSFIQIHKSLISLLTKLKLNNIVINKKNINFLLNIFMCISYLFISSYKEAKKISIVNK